MRKLSFLVVLAALALCYPGTVLSNDSKKGIPLTGEYVGTTQPEVKDVPIAEQGKGEDGVIQPVNKFQDLPVIEKALAEKVAGMDPSEDIRVIIHLAYQPQDVIAEQVRAKHAKEIEAIEAEARAIKARYAEMRDVQADTDAENYRDEILGMSYEDEEALRALNERHEALSLTIKNELVAVLSQEIETYQQSVKDAIQMLGGEVEFGTIAGNALVAVVPVGALEEIAAIDKVARVAEDKLMEQHLNIADDATKVNYGGAGGLWGSGNTGGIYDPAVLDSGTDLDHPALENDADRDNFYSWYLVAAVGHPDWDDVISEDDLNGHGSHVMGIVGSYGSSGWTDYLGMSYGIEKAVTLKAGFNKTNGRASMYHSDAMWLVDRALYDTGNLQPWDTFNDDVDGMNLSYGGDTASDETDYSRFWDSVVSSYSDLVVTLSAGNSGPSNTVFNSPACAYNPITVANVNDQNTASRDDDVIRASSTRGPTENGRRKPDIAAPGSYILSCNNNWETESDFISKSGTSMSAPMVLGVAMDLMDAGVYDEKEIKALLINTAQKNEPGIDFESDSDGWSEAYGWGYMNAWAAYYHRDDVRTASVTERPNAGYYRLYKGEMRDEGSAGEGRDRVTMAWNRNATYNPHDYPTTYYNLSDLNLRLYKEDNNFLIDTDLDGDDNVHQVRINAGAGTTDVVVKAYAWSTNFPHGGTTEKFALATEEDFVEVDLPANFGGIGSWPSEMEPNEERDFEFWLRNNSDIASHSNQFDLILPSGWTRVSGNDPFSAGSIAGEGGYSSHVIWRLRAQSTEEDGVRIISRHTHNSYAEDWGPYNWWMGVNVRWDTTPPTPDPMTWATEPYELNTSQIRMVATTASDLHGPVEYYFFFDELTSGGGGSHSGWQTSTTYTDSGLGTNHQYRYWVRARDNATTPNYTAWSAYSDEYTDIEIPTGITFGTYGSAYINAKSTNTPSNLTSGSSGLIIYNATAGTNSGWKQNNDYWYNGSLTPNTSYAFRARARNGDANETPYSNDYYRRTLAAMPGTAAFSNVTQTSIQANWKPNGNPRSTEYYCENTTAVTNSGWTTSTSWNSTGLKCGNSYKFQVKARNGDGVETKWTSLGDQKTLPCADPCEGDFDDDGDVDGSDLAVFAADFGRTDCANPPPCEGDFDGDGDVDGSDLAVFAADFGRTDCP